MLKCISVGLWQDHPQITNSQCWSKDKVDYFADITKKVQRVGIFTWRVLV